MENEYLCHYGRKGMKRGQHIFGRDDLSPSSSRNKQSDTNWKGHTVANGKAGTVADAGIEKNNRSTAVRAAKKIQKGRAFIDRLMQGGKSYADGQNSNLGARLSRNSASGREASKRRLKYQAGKSNRKSNTSQEYRSEVRYNSRRNH